jgi:RNA polymerase sigma factor (sigma-70 family)
MDLIELLSKDRHHVDEKLRERLYKHYWGYLMGVALRYVADRDLAKTVVNDSFIKVFENMHAFQCVDTENFSKLFKGWMARITARTALNELRKHKFYANQESLTDAHHSAFSVGMEDNLHVENVMNMVNQLQPTYRQVFTLYEIEGFNHDEIAELLGISPSSSRVYLGRAKEKLKMWYQTLMV